MSRNSKSGLVYHGDNLKSGGRNAVLGLAIIIEPPDEAAHKLLFKQNLILEDIYNQLLQSVQQVGSNGDVEIILQNLSGIYSQEKVCCNCL